MRQERMRLEDISKEIYHTKVLKHIHFSLYAGEIIAVMGANGAGKTVLLELLAGIMPYDSGKLYFEAEQLELHQPKDARDLGIQYIPIHGGYIDILTVFENLYFDNGGRFLIRAAEQKKRAKEELERFGLDLNLNLRYHNLDRGKKKLIKIAAAIRETPGILILDEPMVFLNQKQQEILTEVLFELRRKGTCILFTTHSLKLAKQLADRGIILREGEVAGSFSMGQYDENSLAAMVSGGLYKRQNDSDIQSKKQIALKVDALSGAGIENISFKLYEGEILGILGLTGSGRTKIMDLLFGLKKIEKGTVHVYGEEVFITSPKDALKCSIAYATNKVGQMSTIDTLSVKENIVLPSMERVSYSGCISNKLSDYAVRYCLDMVMEGLEQKEEKKVFKDAVLSRPFEEFSLGQQQIIRIAQCLSTAPKILLLDNPTRGLDIKMKKNIYYVLEKLSRKGISILIVSDENEEIFSLCQRYIVLRNGKLSGDISKNEIENIGG